MTLRRLPTPLAPHIPPDRRQWEDVLGLSLTSASPRGSTFWKRLRRCPREHGLVQLKLRKGKPAEHLTVGGIWHFALEAYYKALQEGAPAQNAELAAWAAVMPLRDEAGYMEAPEGREATYPLVERLLGAYFDTYRISDADMQVVAVEETIVYEHAGFSFSARLDLLAVIDGGLWIVEHKTTKAITQDLLSGYQMDLQILGQVWLLQQCIDLSVYPPFQGVIVNIESKHKGGPRFERLRVSPSNEHLWAWQDAQQRWVEVVSVFERLEWPKALGNCTGAARYFSECDYYAICHGRPALTVAQLAKEIATAGAPVGYRLGDDDEEEEDDDAR